MNRNVRPLAFLSLGLLLAALLGSFVVVAFGHDEVPALGFGVAAGLLSLVFAIVSRSEKISRLVLIIILALLIVGIGSIPIAQCARARAFMRERAKMEREAIIQSSLMDRERQRNLNMQSVLMASLPISTEQLRDGRKNDWHMPSPSFFQMRLVLDVAAGDCDCDDMQLVRTKGDTSQSETLHVQHAILLDQRVIKSAIVITNQTDGGSNVEITFTKDGSLRFAEITRKNIGKRLAIVIGGQLYCAPRVMTEILNGKAVVAGRLSQQEADTLAAKITESISRK
jgi:hypothetical protein